MPKKTTVDITQQTVSTPLSNEPARGCYPTRVYCHIGVHIYNRCETTFNANDGYTLQEVPHGILVSCQPDSRYVGKDHKVLVTWANIHAIRYDE